MKMTAPLEVGLTVRDLPKMRAFYEGVMELTFVSEVYVPGPKADEAAMSTGGYTALRLQTSHGERIKLLAPDATPADHPAAADKILDHAASSYITFIVDDIDGVVARLIAGGGTLMTAQPVVEVRPGTFLSFLRDPEGHIIEIVRYADIAAYRPDLAQVRA